MPFHKDKIPQLVTPKKIDLEKFEAREVKLGDSRRQVIKEDVRDFDSVTDFLRKVNEFNLEQERNIFESAIPGFSRLQTALTGQATELAEGAFNLPKGVQSLLESRAAQQGIATGIGLDSTAGQLDLLRTFGLTGLREGRANLATSESLLRTVAGTGPRVNAVNPFAFFSTTQEQQTANQRFEDSRLATDIRFKEATQVIDQSFENARAAVRNQQAVLDASKRSTFERVTDTVSGVAQGAIQGFAAGGPWGAVAGGIVGGVTSAGGQGPDPSIIQAVGLGAGKAAGRKSSAPVGTSPGSPSIGVAGA